MQVDDTTQLRDAAFLNLKEKEILHFECKALEISGTKGLLLHGALIFFVNEKSASYRLQLTQASKFENLVVVADTLALSIRPALSEAT